MSQLPPVSPGMPCMIGSALYNRCMDAFFDKFLKKTVWLWLPFFALYRSILGIVELIEERSKKNKAL